MINLADLEAVNVKDLNLWSHVGVLDSERILGQRFTLSFTIWSDISNVLNLDDVSSFVDYSQVIEGLQKLALDIECQTIECFSEKILDFLETLYGNAPMQILLVKCRPPVDGFTGSVSIQRNRNFPSGYSS